MERESVGANGVEGFTGVMAAENAMAQRKAQRDVMTELELNELSRKVIGCCIQVHKYFGPGLFEKIYENSLLEELRCSGIRARAQVEVELTYRGKALGKGYYIDILVEEEIILEIKAVDVMNPIYDTQLLSYLKLADKRLGLLVNFNAPTLVAGVKRMVNNL